MGGRTACAKPASGRCVGWRRWMVRRCATWPRACRRGILHGAARGRTHARARNAERDGRAATLPGREPVTATRCGQAVLTARTRRQAGSPRLAAAAARPFQTGKRQYEQSAPFPAWEAGASHARMLRGPFGLPQPFAAGERMPCGSGAAGETGRGLAAQGRKSRRTNQIGGRCNLFAWICRHPQRMRWGCRLMKISRSRPEATRRRFAGWPRPRRRCTGPNNPLPVFARR